MLGFGKNFYADQRDLLGILLGWGVASTVLGLGTAVAADPLLRQLGLQSAGWGLIDAALAINGQRDAERKLARLAAGEIDAAQLHRDAEFLQRLLLINAGLDVLYIATGSWMASSAGPRRGRLGAGIAVLVQGSFLLVFDLAFAAHIWFYYLREQPRLAAGAQPVG